jgi:hypothetical protein
MVMRFMAIPPHSDSIMSLLLAYIAAVTETEKFCVHAAPLWL